MNRLDKIKLAIKKGITCDPTNGIVYGVKGNEIKGITKGYKTISLVEKGKIYRLAAHQFIFYYVNNKIVDVIDHINRDKLDNRIDNLRETNQHINILNVNNKGYYYHKVAKKWCARIQINGVNKYLGLYENEIDASNAYITEKQKYI